MRSVCTGILALFMTAGVASTAAAQSRIDNQVFRTLRFTADSGKEARSLPFRPARAPLRQGATGLQGIVLGGYSSTGGGGFAVGAGAVKNNFLGREHFGLQIDGLYSNAGGCEFCDDFDDSGFSASSIAVSGAVLYKFNEASSGWQPFAGGGLVWSRVSYSYDDNFVCGVLVDCSSSASAVGLQIQGGVAKRNLHFEARFAGSYGGSFLLLAGYKFGGG